MALCESETLELKKSTSELKEAIISIAAMLNKHGQGELYLGVKNDGAAIGQQISEKTIRGVSQAISTGIEPKIYPKIDKVKAGDKDCVLVAFSGENAPYFAFGRAYMRVGDEDRQLSAAELEKIIIEKNRKRLEWDSQSCREASLADIDEGKLRKFVHDSKRDYGSIRNSLQKLKLLKGEKPLNAAIILFGKEPQKFFRNAKLRCAVFATNNASAIIDMKEFEGDLFYLMDEAEGYLLKNIHTGMALDGLKRIDVPEINQQALREAITNAFCHRDYWKADSINVAVFKDRVEVRSPGLLFGDLTIQKIRTEHVSERRNELIAQAFHDVGFVEMWGHGISKILGFEPQAEFKEVGTHFITALKRKEDVGANVGANVGKKSRLIRILERVSQGQRFTHKTIAKDFGVDEKTIERDLRKLKNEGKIMFIGSRKSGHWEIMKK